MPAVSQAQQALMAIAKYKPSAVSVKNRGVLKMSDKALTDFASTPIKKLPKRKGKDKNFLRVIAGGE
jgi:hypothetical protein